LGKHAPKIEVTGVSNPNGLTNIRVRNGNALEWRFAL